LVGIQADDVSQVATLAHQKPKVSPLFRQSPDNVAADKSGRACDESFHLSHQLSAFSRDRDRTCIAADEKLNTFLTSRLPG
jgi:hypothetical protein